MEDFLNRYVAEQLNLAITGAKDKEQIAADIRHLTKIEAQSSGFEVLEKMIHEMAKELED